MIWYVEEETRQIRRFAVEAPDSTAAIRKVQEDRESGEERLDPVDDWEEGPVIQRVYPVNVTRMT